MSKKDYEALAKALANCRPDPSLDEFSGWQAAAHSVANALEQLNPRFSREKFIEACMR